jgi:hypothetical protein
MSKTHLTGFGIGTLLLALVVGLPLRAADEPIDYQSINLIKAEGLSESESQVMDVASWLTDVHGPRLSGSPSIEKAGAWAVAKMTEWGLTGAAMEPWTENRGFTQGWSNDKFYLAAVEPQAFPMYAMSQAWTPGTNGLVRGEAMLVTGTTEAELAPLRGKLRGKFLLVQAPVDVPAYWTPQADRYTTEELDALQLASNPGLEFGLAAAGRGGRVGGPGRGGGGGAPFNRNEFFKAEGVVAILQTNGRGHGLFLSGSGSRSADPATQLADIRVAAEHYNRVARNLQKGIPVTLEADITNTYHPNPTMFNVVGEIRGTDKADELVMLGAHFDSWHPGTGATDNAAGSAAMMEAMRILKESGVPLRRTVRIGLWNGEEQGLNGSRNYVEAHFAARGAAPAGAGAGAAAGGARAGGQPAAPGRGRGRGNQGPLELKPDHAKFSAYFNIDNGTGAIRGIYLQGNDALAPIFRAWMEPLRSIGMTHLTIRNTGGTDHQSFDGVGLPGFQFIQDSVEYNTVTHHYNMDTYERLQPDDMRKNATIAAVFAFLAANREERLPRKPLPEGAGGRGRGGQ